MRWDPAPVIECVVNVSEGRDRGLVAELAAGAARALLDIHSDPHHHRSVLTLAGPDPAPPAQSPSADRRAGPSGDLRGPSDVQSTVRDLARLAVERLDIRAHRGVHPRIGVLDVVPFVALEGWPVRSGPPWRAMEERDRFAGWAARELGLPVFLYGPERSLPELRRRAWRDLGPDLGPAEAHPRAGAVAVGARPPLVAYNLWLRDPDLALAGRIAASLRSPSVRALGLAVGEAVQVSFNLLAPCKVGPAQVWDAVAASVPLARAELVGLVPAKVLEAIPRPRWRQLDLDEERTIEARWARLRQPEAPAPEQDP